MTEKMKRIHESMYQNGYHVIDNVFSKADIKEMQERIDLLRLGFFKKGGRRFQVDADSGVYDEAKKINSKYQGPDKNYRKIADLEFDEVFLRQIKNQKIREITVNLLGETVSIMRLTVMNKAANAGTYLPWHQDVANSWPTTIQPKLAIWFPIDEITENSGTLQVMPGSHMNGMIKDGHLLENSCLTKYIDEHKVKSIIIDPGSCLFFDTNILHRSETNKTNRSRRAVNGILIPGPSYHTIKKKNYPVLFGQNEIEPNQVKNVLDVF